MPEKEVEKSSEIDLLLLLLLLLLQYSSGGGGVNMNDGDVSLFTRYGHSFFRVAYIYLFMQVFK